MLLITLRVRYFRCRVYVFADIWRALMLIFYTLHITDDHVFMPCPRFTLMLLLDDYCLRCLRDRMASFMPC